MLEWRLWTYAPLILTGVPAWGLGPAPGPDPGRWWRPRRWSVGRLLQDIRAELWQVADFQPGWRRSPTLWVKWRPGSSPEPPPPSAFATSDDDRPSHQPVLDPLTASLPPRRCSPLPERAKVKPPAPVATEAGGSRSNLRLTPRSRCGWSGDGGEGMFFRYFREIFLIVIAGVSFWPSAG